jgi:hypothetical protein
MNYKRVYVAGSYSSDNVIQVFKNMKKGIEVCAGLLKKDYIPFCPWLDYHFFFYEDITLEEIQSYSIGWLEVSDCLYVLKNSENSKGTQNEIKVAKELGIPVLYEGKDEL